MRVRVAAVAVVVMFTVAGCTFAPPAQPALPSVHPAGVPVVNSSGENAAYLEVAAEGLIAREASGRIVRLIAYSEGADAVVTFVTGFLGRPVTELLIGCTEYPVASTWPSVDLRIQYARTSQPGALPPLVVVAGPPPILAPLQLTTTDRVGVGEDATDWLGYFHDNGALASDGSMTVRYDFATPADASGPLSAVATIDTESRIAELRAPTRLGVPPC